MDEQQRKVGFTVVAENETKGTFQEIKSDAKEMAGSVEQAGQRAARGINAIGDSAEGAAQKLTREEGRMSAALLRATEQAQIAARAGDSLSKAFEIKGELRGLDMSRMAPMVAQLREAEQALAAFKAQQAQQSSQSAFLDSLRAQTETMGKTKVELLELRAAQLGLTSQAAPYIAQIRNMDSAMGNAGKTAGDLQWAMRGVPAQLSDIAVSIQGGMPAMTIFFQQGLQLRDMFGGFVPAARGVADWKRRAKEDGDPKWQEGITKLQAQVDAAKVLPGMAASVDNYVASLQANNKAYVDATEAFSQMSDQFAPKEIKRKQELTVAENKYKAAVEATKKAFADMPELEGKLADLGKQFEQTKAGINKRYEEKGSAKPARDALSIDVYGTKKELEGLLNVYSSSQKIMEAQRSAGLLADREYYEARRGFINLEADAQERLLQQELSRFQQEKVTKENRLQVEKGIADTQAKIDKARIERAAALQVIDVQEKAAINAKEAAYNAAARAAADYLVTLQRGFDRNVLAVGWGSEQRNIEAGRQQLEDRFLQQRQELANQRAKAEFDANGKLNDDQKRYYAERLELIEVTESIAMARYNDGVARRQAAEGDWLNGVKRAWSDYSYSAANVAQMSADAFSNAFKGMEDALVSFTMTGKADFKSMANAFIADIVRIQARAALSGLFGGALNALGLGGIGGRLGITPNAKGGVYDSPSLSVYRNQVHDTPKMFAFAHGAGVFGEAGPEAIMPLTRAPDGNLGVRALAPLPTPGGAPSVQVEVYVDASTGASQVQATAGHRGGGDAAAQQQLGKMLGGMFKDMLTREMRPGGVLWSYRNGRA